MMFTKNLILTYHIRCKTGMDSVIKRVCFSQKNTLAYEGDSVFFCLCLLL